MMTLLNGSYDILPIVQLDIESKNFFIIGQKKVFCFTQILSYSMVCQKSIMSDKYSRLEDMKKANQKQKKDNQLMIYTRPPEGLPNIGNTCHLNSSIQLLYCSKDFVELIGVISTRNSSSTSSIKLIDNLFKSLDVRGSQAKSLITSKKENLQQLATKLESLNLTYKRGHQEDVFETINNFIHNLQYAPQQKDAINRLFTVKAQKKCQCMSYGILTETIFPSFDQTCEGCHQKFKLTNTTTSKYLILTHPNQIPLVLSIIGKSYKFIGCIVYSGTGASGHYICIRNEYGKLYRISDRSVTPITQYELKSYENKYHSDYSLSKRMIYMALYKLWTLEDDQREKEVNELRILKRSEVEQNDKKPGKVKAVIVSILVLFALIFLVVEIIEHKSR